MKMRRPRPPQTSRGHPMARPTNCNMLTVGMRSRRLIGSPKWLREMRDLRAPHMTAAASSRLLREKRMDWRQHTQSCKVEMIMTNHHTRPLATQGTTTTNRPLSEKRQVKGEETGGKLETLETAKDRRRAR